MREKSDPYPNTGSGTFAIFPLHLHKTFCYTYPCDELVTSSCRLVLASVPWRARAGLEVAFLFLGVVPKQKTD